MSKGNQQTITGHGLKELATVTAQLVREGLTFEAEMNISDPDSWIIVLTGGF